MQAAVLFVLNTPKRGRMRCRGREHDPLRKTPLANRTKEPLQYAWHCSGSCVRFLYAYRNELAVNLGHVSDEFEHLVRVTDFVVVPRYNLNEGVGESDTSLSVEDRGTSVTEEVA